MKNWLIFENECAEYLQEKYSNKVFYFKATGGHDSNSSDIKAFKDKQHILSIECKMNTAQCGQFVLFIDYANHKFIFSNKNKTPYDDFTKSVIEEMERHFEQCSIPSAKDLPISENIISQWVKNYYLNHKKSKYCITKSDIGFIIFPIENMDNYFAFSAKYRVKKSGSSNPSKNNISEIENLLQNINVKTTIEIINSKCYAEFNYTKDKFILCGDKYRYQFTKDDAKYNIRRLSNTCNANFIVSIKLKEHKQHDIDLMTFEQDLIK